MIPVLAILAAMGVCAAVDVVAQQQPPAARSVRLTIHAPEPQEFEVALDEVELDWGARRSSAPPAAERTAPPNARFTRVKGPRAVVAVTGVSTLEGVAALGRQLEAGNQGADAHLVLYEGSARTQSARRVLTGRVALLLDNPQDPDSIVKAYAARSPKPLAGVPGAYVLEAADPLNAIELADSLRLRSGVKSAYPVMKRSQFAR